MDDIDISFHYFMPYTYAIIHIFHRFPPPPLPLSQSSFHADSFFRCCRFSPARQFPSDFRLPRTFTGAGAATARPTTDDREPAFDSAVIRLTRVAS